MACPWRRGNKYLRFWLALSAQLIFKGSVCLLFSRPALHRLFLMARQSVTRWACPHALGPQELVVPCLCRLLKDETFADARYMMELLRQTFAALDRANRELGYVHRFAGALTGISVPAVQHRAPCSRDQHSVVKQMLLLFAGCRDMRVGNIMEHRPEGELMLPEGFSKEKKKRNAFKLPGAGTRTMVLVATSFMAWQGWASG